MESGPQRGHGFLFRAEGGCHLVAPKHLFEGESGLRRRATVLSAAPVEAGSVFVEAPFWAGMDLAVGLVRGPVAGRCVLGPDALSGAARPETGETADLVRLTETGETERLPMRVTATGYLTLEAETTRPGDELFQSTSGAFLFVGSRPVGMAIELLPDSEIAGRFIRMEEIEANVLRWIGRGGALFAEAPPAPLAPAPGLPVARVEAGAAVIGPGHGPENLFGDGAYIFTPSGPNRIAFRFEGEAPVALRKVELRTDPEAAHAVPREIYVEVSAAEDGSRPRRFLSGEMGPDGVFSLERSSQNARWVFVTIRSAYKSGPVRLDSARFE